MSILLRQLGTALYTFTESVTITMELYIGAHVSYTLAHRRNYHLLTCLPIIIFCGDIHCLQDSQWTLQSSQCKIIWICNVTSTLHSPISSMHHGRFAPPVVPHMMSRVHPPWNSPTFPQHLINAPILLVDHHRGRHVHLSRGPPPFPCYLMELPMPPAHHQQRHVHTWRCPQRLSCHLVDSLTLHVDHHLWRLVYSPLWLPRDTINAQLPSVDHHLRCHTHFLRCPPLFSPNTMDTSIPYVGPHLRSLVHQG